MDINNYLNLIPSDNIQKPKFMAYLKAILDHAADLSGTVESIALAFNLENAAGAQLDIIGDLIGLKRQLKFVPTEGGDQMSDEEYRIMIKMTIARHRWNGSNETAVQIYKEIFENLFNIWYQDNLDCTVDIYISGIRTTREAEIMNAADGYLVPAGVGKTVNVIGGNVDLQPYIGTGVCGIEQVHPAQML